MSNILYNKVVTDGMVLYLDPGNVKSFKGEPTTNVITNTDLDTGWSKDYNRDIIIGDTSQGFPPNVDSQVVSFVDDGTPGGYWYSYGDYAPQADSTTYSLSIWAKTYGTNWSIQPYTADNSEVHRFWMSAKTVVGDGTWQRLEWPSAFTTPVNNDSDSLSFLLGIPSNQRCWLCAPQLEPKAYCTPFVNGTRGASVATGGGLGDLSRCSNSGELVNGPTYNSSNGGTVVFDGIDDKIQTTYAPAFGDFSVCVWFKDGGSDSWGRIIDKSYTDGFFISSHFASTGANYVGAGIIEPSSPYGICLPYQAGVYHFFTTVRSGTTHTIYLDGIEQTNSKTVSSNLLSTVPIAFGTWSTTIDQLFKGNLGNCIIYNRALSTSEILQNYNATKSRFI